MSFGYFPDFKGKSPLKDLYLKIVGYPYPSRKNEAIMVFDMLDAKPGEKILDIGCGDGIFTNELAKRGINVTGIDVSSHDLSVAKKRAKQMGLKVKYLKMDAQKMKFKNNTFDKIYSISTIEHIPNDQKVFNECQRILKEKGEIIISIPNDKNIMLVKLLLNLPAKIKSSIFNSLISNSSTYSDYIKKLDNKFVHHRRYTPGGLRKKLLKHKFKTVRVKYSVSLISKIPHSVIHTLKIFEWNKKRDTGYQYSNQSEILMAIVFPLIYICYYIDRILFSKIQGLAIVNKSIKTK